MSKIKRYFSQLLALHGHFFLRFLLKMAALHLSRPPGPKASIMLAPPCGGAHNDNCETFSVTMAVYVSPSMRQASMETLKSILPETSSLGNCFTDSLSLYCQAPCFHPKQPPEREVPRHDLSAKLKHLHGPKSIATSLMEHTTHSACHKT